MMEGVKELSADIPMSVTVPDEREKNSPRKSKKKAEEDLKVKINKEIYKNIRFYLKVLYDNAATETDVIVLKALWREIKRLMEINGIKVEKRER